MGNRALGKKLKDKTIMIFLCMCYFQALIEIRFFLLDKEYL